MQIARRWKFLVRSVNNFGVELGWPPFPQRSCCLAAHIPQQQVISTLHGRLQSANNPSSPGWDPDGAEQLLPTHLYPHPRIANQLQKSAGDAGPPRGMRWAERAAVRSKHAANRRAEKGAPWGVFKCSLITLAIHQPRG